MYGESPTGSKEMGKIVTDWHCDRLKKLIDTSGGTILCGGKVNRDIKYVEATIIVDPQPSSDVMSEEIFGPILPVLSFSKIDEAIDFINKKDKPLAVYYFGKAFYNANRDRLLNETSSGQFVVNEVIT